MPPKKPKTHRWYEVGDNDYVLAEQDARDPEVFVVKSKGVSKPIDGKWVPANPPHQDGVPDNTQLMHLTEPGLLHNIRHRYSKDEIYSYTGYILIAVNPYRRLPLYDDETLASYQGKSIGTMPPHVYAVADRAFRSMKTDHTSQSILVSGESGAGKTETSKLVMQFLVKVGGRSDAGGQVENKILQSNPVMEAFGNAKTLRNNNSSRFGKYMQLHFSKSLQVAGASIVTYLLEKSRIVHQSKGERNYHSFYQLCAGATADEKKDLQLLPAEEFRYLNQGEACKIDGVDDAADFAVLRKAMQSIGIDDDKQRAVFRLLAGILHLGNVEFKDSRRSDNAQIVDQKPVKTAATLFGVDEVVLNKRLLTRSMVTRGEKFEIPLKMQEASYLRDVLAKLVYGRVFDWLVTQINRSLVTDDESVAFVGILDIFGFETFETNRFEQLCINYCNERLQQHFNENIFIQEQEIYDREGIKAPHIEYEDNQVCLDMIAMKKTGIFAILDEEMRLPKPSDKNFTKKVYNSHKDNPRLKQPKRGKQAADEVFIVRHYAGEVCYTTEGFLDTNNDVMHPDHGEVMSSSQLELAKELFEGDSEPKKSGSRFNSVGGGFCRSLDSLMENLRTTVSHFIRCIKPNSKQQAALFDPSLVLTQLRCNGMMAALQLMHAGYPTRCPYDDLYGRFRPMLPDEIANMPPPLFCEALLMALDVAKEDFALGLTRLFFRSGKLAFLEDLRSEGSKLPADIVQRVKRWLARKRWRRAIWSIRAFNACATRLRQLRALAKFIKVGHWLAFIGRSWIKLARAIRRRHAARRLQAFMRMAVARSRYLRTRRATAVINRRVRGWLVYKKYKPVLAQRRKERGEQARREAQRLKAEQEERKRQQAEEERKRREEEERKREEERQRQLQLEREEKERKERERLRLAELEADNIRKKMQAEFEKEQAERERLARQEVERQEAAAKAAAEAAAASETAAQALKSDNAQLTKENAALKREVEKLRTKVTAAELERREVDEKKSAEILSLRKKLAEQVDTLQAQLDEQLDSTAESEQMLEEKVGKLSIELAKKNSDLSHLERQLESEKKARDEARTEWEHETQMLRSDLKDAQERRAMFERQLGEVSTRQESLKEAQKSVIADWEAKVDSLRAELDTANKAKGAAERQVMTMQQSIEADQDRDSDELDTLRRELDQAKSAQRRAGEQNKSLNAQMEELQAQLQEERERAAENLRKVRRVKSTEADSAEGNGDAIGGEALEQLRSEAADARKAAKTAQDKAAVAVKKLETQITILNIEKQSLEEDNDQLREKIEQLETESTGASSSQNEKLSQMIAKFDEVRREKDQLQTKIFELQQKDQEQTLMLQKGDKEAFLHKEVTSAKEDKIKLQTEVNDLQADNIRLKKTVQELEALTDRQKGQITELGQHKDAVQQQNEHMLGELNTLLKEQALQLDRHNELQRQYDALKQEKATQGSGRQGFFNKFSS